MLRPRTSLTKFSSAILCFGLWSFFAAAQTESVETSELIYVDPHKAVIQFSKIMQQTSPALDAEGWLKAALKLSSAHFHIGDLENVPAILDKAIPLAEKLQNPDLLAQLLIQRHILLSADGKSDLAHETLLKALQQAERSHQPRLMAMIQVYQGVEANLAGHPERSAELFHSALIAFRDVPHDARYLSMMNSIATFLSDYDTQSSGESVSIFAEITKIIDSKGLHFLGVIAYRNYAEALSTMEKVDEAMACFKKSLEHALIIHDEVGIGEATYGRGTMLLKMKHYDEAMKQFAAARPIIAKYNNQTAMYYLDMAEAEALINLGRIDEAARLAKKIRSSIIIQKNPTEQAQFTELEAHILEKSQSSYQAMLAYKKLSELNRQIHNSRNQELAQRYHAEFEVERRNQKNQILAQENALQAVKLESQVQVAKITRYALVTVIAILGILALSFYRSHSHKRQIQNLQRYIETNVLQRFLPPILVQEILNGTSRLDEDTKIDQVTVLFADLCHFTRATDILGPETITRILNDFFVSMTEVIFNQGGTIDKFIGDAIMVIFGAPAASPPEDQAHAAVRCALEMQEQLRALNRIWETREGTHFEMRIGIHQGQAVIGTFGGSKRSDYTVVGTSVNLASRVESVAEPNSIFVTEAIARFLPADGLVPRGNFRLKGFDTDVPLYSVDIDRVEFQKEVS